VLGRMLVTCGPLDPLVWRPGGEGAQVDGLLEAHIWASCHKLDRRLQEHEEALRLDSAPTAWALLNDLNERIQ